MMRGACAPWGVREQENLMLHARAWSDVAMRYAAMGLASQRVVTHRLARAAALEPGSLGRRDRAEFTGMVTEKYLAGAEAMHATALALATFQVRLATAWMLAATRPWSWSGTLSGRCRMPGTAWPESSRGPGRGCSPPAWRPSPAAPTPTIGAWEDEAARDDESAGAPSRMPGAGPHGQPSRRAPGVPQRREGGGVPLRALTRSRRPRPP